MNPTKIAMVFDYVLLVATIACLVVTIWTLDWRWLATAVLSFLVAAYVEWVWHL